MKKGCKSWYSTRSNNFQDEIVNEKGKGLCYMLSFCSHLLCDFLAYITRDLSIYVGKWTKWTWAHKIRDGEGSPPMRSHWRATWGYTEGDAMLKWLGYGPIPGVPWSSQGECEALKSKPWSPSKQSVLRNGSSWSHDGLRWWKQEDRREQDGPRGSTWSNERRVQKRQTRYIIHLMSCTE